MKKIILLFILFSFACANNLKAQSEEAQFLFQKFLKAYNSGDLISSNDILLTIINSNTPLPDWYMVSIYNNICVVNTRMGRFDKALEYNEQAERLINLEQRKSADFADICINKAYIYTLQKSFNSAIEYLEKAIRIYDYINERSNKRSLQSLSAAYLNIGIAYYEIKNYKSSLGYFNKSVGIKAKHDLTGIGLGYLNIAKTYVKTGNPKKAEEFYLNSIDRFISEYNKDYYRLAEVYFDYSLFLRSVKRIEESVEILKKASSICINNYGEKHTLVSLSYKMIGDGCLNQNKPDSALYYYQKSLFAVAKGFNDPDIFKNPSIDSSLFDIRLLDNLKSKAQALELLAGEQNDYGMKIKSLKMSLETIELALQLIDRIRNNYMSEESRIYLAENEKETYIFATHLAYIVYSATHDSSVGFKMYNIAQRAKAAILRNEITGNEVFYSEGIPDSLRNKQNRLSGNIIAYNNLILEETRKTDPDSDKISLWKDAIFDMNREKEKVNGDIEKVFPQYHELLRKAEPVSLDLIREQLNKDETIVDYLLSNQNSGGKRRLFLFLISRRGLDFRELWLDSLFARNAEIIRKTANPAMANGSQSEYFTNYTGALNYMYLNLIKPVEMLFEGNRLIIIPDEEIGWLPFDAFLKYLPSTDQTGYEGLHYLVNDYTFSYGYSSSLIFSKNRNIRGAKVFAFSPGYRNKTASGNELSSLQGADDEIGSIFKLFSGNTFSGENATKANFISALQDHAIFHLAMHSISDTINSNYSYLMFDAHKNSTEESKLYNCEISLTRIKSPMVVLSACNSGTGTLYSGEGLMSMARGFTLAGAASVIKTSWEINDEASEAIMTRFYFHLSKGKEKNEAMRFAKLEYLESSPPSFTNPYYWAAYEVLGDNEPVARKSISTVIILSLMVILAAVLAAIYFKRRRIFSERAR